MWKIKYNFLFINFLFTCIIFVILIMDYAISESPKLDQGLFSIDQETRESALKELSVLDIDSKKELIPSLIEAVKSDYKYIRLGAFDALARIGSQAVPVPDIIKILKDENTTFRKRAIEALGRLGPEAKEAVPVLIQALKDNEIRSYAADTLGKIGSEAREAVPTLIKLLNNKDMRYTIPNVLGKIGATSVPALIQALKDEDARVRSGAAFALTNIGAEAIEAIPALIEALKDQDRDVRQSASTALFAIGRVAKDDIPKLIEILKTGDKEARFSAARVLVKIDPGIEEAISVLVQALEGKDQVVRHVAIYTLSKIERPDPAYKKAVPSLIRIFLDNDPYNTSRLLAAEALGKISLWAEEAVPFLVKALKESESIVRSRVANALEGIGTREAIKAVNHYRKEEDLRARRSEQEKQRLYTKEEMLASKPDNELRWKVSVKGWNQDELLITRHTRWRPYEEKPDRLVIWLRVKDKFKILKVMEADAGSGVSPTRHPVLDIRKRSFFILFLIQVGRLGTIKRSYYLSCLITHCKKLSLSVHMSGIRNRID